MTRPGIKPQFRGSLANTLTIIPMSGLKALLAGKRDEQNGKGKGDTNWAAKYMASLDKSRDTPSRRKEEVIRWFYLTETSTYIRDYFSW